MDSAAAGRLIPLEMEISPARDHPTATIGHIVRSGEEFIRDIFNNSYAKPVAGWSANLVNAAAFRGTTVFLSTLLRELAADATTKALERASDETKLTISGILVATTALANVAATVKKHREGATSPEHIWASTANTGLLITAAGLIGKDRLAAAAPHLAKANIYALARSGLDQVFRTSANMPSSATSKLSLVSHVPAYALNQILVNLGQDFRAYSGTSGRAEQTTTEAALAPLAAYSAFNATGEAFDYLVDRALGAYFKDTRVDPRGRPDAAADESALERSGATNVAKLRVTGELRRPSDNLMDTLLGPTTGRASSLMLLYMLIAGMSKTDAEGRLTPSINHVAIDAIAGVAFAVLCGIADLRGIPRRPPPQAPVPEA